MHFYPLDIVLKNRYPAVVILTDLYKLYGFHHLLCLGPEVGPYDVAAVLGDQDDVSQLITVTHIDTPFSKLIPKIMQNNNVILILKNNIDFEQLSEYYDRIQNKIALESSDKCMIIKYI